MNGPASQMIAKIDVQFHFVPLGISFYFFKCRFKFQMKELEVQTIQFAVKGGQWCFHKRCQAGTTQKETRLSTKREKKM